MATANNPENKQLQREGNNLGQISQEPLKEDEFRCFKCGQVHTTGYMTTADPMCIPCADLFAF